MSKMTREEKLFRRENDVLEKYQRLSQQEISVAESKEALTKLTDRYEALLDQTRFLTWISGRLERKLQRTNKELRNNNEELQHTLDELTKSEASRSASAIIYFVAIALFVLEEYFVEPVINVMGDSAGYSILIKLMIVILLKVAEGFLEKKITRKRQLNTVSDPPAVADHTPQAI
jgi:chromosome segregation ATPase